MRDDDSMVVRLRCTRVGGVWIGERVDTSGVAWRDVDEWCAREPWSEGVRRRGRELARSRCLAARSLVGLSLCRSLVG